MSDMKCPFCQQELHSASINGEWLECWNCSYNEPDGHKLPQAIFMGTKELWQELITTRKALDDSEHCCTEWEKQALDYKAENIKLSTALDKAIWWLNEIVKNHRFTPISTAEKALAEINEIKGDK